MLIPFTELKARHNIVLNDVLHLGANTGQEAETYHKLGAKRVIWVEAIRPVYDGLCRHIAAFPNQVAIHACISDKLEEVEMKVTNNAAQSSSILDFGTHATEHPTVKVIRTEKMMASTVESILAAAGHCLLPGAFLNIDLQGAELMALRGMEGLMPFFDHAYIEVNVQHLYKGCPLVGEIDDFMMKHGFDGREQKMTGNGWGDKYYKRVNNI